jgi:L-fuculose-phosphate aldolase
MKTTYGLRLDVIETCRAMNARGVNTGKAGNVSVRVNEGYLITPSGLAYDAMVPAHICQMNMNGESAGPLAPSSEWRFHHDIFAVRADVQAIVHTHSTNAAALSTHGRGIPAFHYMVAVAGGRDIACAPYATFGSQALSDGAVKALRERKACLLAHHGVIATGASLHEALDLACEVEQLATMYLAALRIGEPPVLSNVEMDRVLDKFKTYGQQPEVEVAL